MKGERTRYGLLISGLGSVALAISVFLPWYGISVTANGVAAAKQVAGQVVSQFGNATLQGYAGHLNLAFGTLVGRQLATVTAHESLHDISVVLLVIAAIAMLDSLLPLARGGDALPSGAGGAVVLLGFVAAACVGYRIISPPAPDGELVSLSIAHGAWIALAGSLAMIGGGLTHYGAPAAAPSQERVNSALAGLSGFTPEI